MKTGQHLKIESFGEKVQGVTLHGDPRKPEPESFRVNFPGGVLDIERCSDNSYWVHVIAMTPDTIMKTYGPDSGQPVGRFAEARMHLDCKHSAEADLGDFENPGLYDVALRVVRS